MTVLACEQNYQVRGVVCDIEGFRERLLAWIARELRDEEVPQVNINDGVLSFSGGFLLGLQWGRSLNLIDKGRAEVTSIGEEVSVKCSVVIKRIQWYVLLVCGVLLVGGVLGVCLGRAEAVGPEEDNRPRDGRAPPHLFHQGRLGRNAHQRGAVAVRAGT